MMVGTTNNAAVEAPTVAVDPGQIIRVNARFYDLPEKVLFSYLPPGSDVAVHDPGADKDETLIQHGDNDLYHYSIDTRLMHGGLGWWYFSSEDSDPQKRRAKVGKFIVRDVPRALLERGGPTRGKSTIEEDSGFDLLGALSIEETRNDGNATHVLVGVGVAIGAALLLGG